MKNFIKQMPGFRSDTTWKKVIASIGYIFLLLGVLPIVFQGTLVDSLWNGAQIIAMIAFVAAVIALFKGNVKLLHIVNRKVALLVLVVSLIAAGAMPFPAGSEQAEVQEQETDQSENNELEAEKAAEKEIANLEQKEKPTSEQDTAQNQEKEVSKEKQSVEQENESAAEEKEQSAKKTATPQKQADHGPDAQVTRVVDGDTVKIKLNGQEETVRLLLVDTPETKHPSKPVQPFGPEASSFAKQELAGKKIEVEYDGPKRDKYGRLLAYIWVDGKMFNQMLLEEGLARLAYVYDPPYTHYQEYMKAQNRAKNKEKGIWSRDGYVRDDGFYYGRGTEKNSSGNNNSSSTEEKASENEANEGEKGSSSSTLKYDPNGPDRDCGDFDTQQQAQDFFEAAGGPAKDPHRLDGRDGDGIVCESLP